MLRIKKYLSRFLFGVCITALFSSCICDYNDYSQCETVDKGNSDEEGVTFEFSLVTRNVAGSSSRALVEPEDGTTLIGSLPENYLDLDNLTFLLFDDSRKLLRVFSPEVEAENTDEYIKYRVRAFLNDKYFLRATTDNITFTIVVLGNYAGLDSKRFAYHIGQRLEDVFAADKVGTFAMPKSNGGIGWIPSILGGSHTIDGTTFNLTRAHIPMAGMQTFTISVAALRASTLDNPYQLSSEVGGKDINMLRALAKIEVIDNITPLVEDAEGTGSRIEKVELVGYNTRGSILPLLAQWNLAANPYETQYVTGVSVPTGTDGASYVSAVPETDLTVVNSTALVDFFKTVNDDGKPVFVCYLTEYAPPGADIPPMWIRITTSVDGGSGTSTLHRLDVAPYTGNASGAAMPILRNNIYRYEITGITPTLRLTLTVNPWTAETITWDYSDNLAFTADGYLEWTGGDVSPAVAQVLYSNNTLVGTFAFDQPRGGSEWHAALIPANTDTQEDAFYFVDEDGNKLDVAPSGIINGQKASIRIAALPNTTDKNWAARLIFTVSTFDGRIITANVLDPNTYGTNKYFTITQNAQQ